MARGVGETGGDSPKGGRSGARGGPPLARGVIYQIYYGVLRALYLIAQALGDPITRMTIGIEPRLISDPELTQWDLRLVPPDRSIEAKWRPSKKDMLNFLTVASKAHDPRSPREYCLVYSKEPPLLSALEKLHRLANDAEGDAATFKWLVDFEHIANDGTDEVLAAVGDNAHLVFREVAWEHITEQQLVRELRHISESIAGPVGGKQLRRMLFVRLFMAMPNRTTFDIGELIQEAREEEIPLKAGAITSTPGLPAKALDTIGVLQICPDPLPLGVMAGAVNLSESELRTLLTPLISKEHLAIADDCLRLRDLSSPMWHPGPEEVTARTLEGLLDHIHRTTDKRVAVAQVANAKALAQECTKVRPSAVAPIFETLHNMLKDLGDKHQVIEVANLTIAAARAVGSGRTNRMVEYEAQARVCGLCWGLQRLGRLTDAMAQAELSLRQGESVGYHRNTAFCLKCIGRLFRMEAEELKDPASRKPLLVQSEEYLCRAIGAFGADRGAATDPEEEGACWSLLGRTYMEMGRTGKAREAVAEAYDLITDLTGKDYADLLILHGELDARGRDYEAAHDLFSRALAIPTCGDARRNEIRARAHLQLGRNWQARGDHSAAIADYKKAEAIWNILKEQERAAEARWGIEVLTDLPETALKRLVAGEPYMVRLAALELRREDLAQLGTSHRGRRSDPSNQYWKRLLARACSKAEREKIEL